MLLVVGIGLGSLVAWPRIRVSGEIMCWKVEWWSGGRLNGETGISLTGTNYVIFANVAVCRFVVIKDTSI
jgi:hypothetical protein